MRLLIGRGVRGSRFRFWMASGRTARMCRSSDVISKKRVMVRLSDEERIEYYDEIHSVNEDRYVGLGCVQGILYVVCTMRGEAARLISARMATVIERRVYYGD